MIPVSHVLAFAAVAAVLIAVPGPSVLFTVSRAVTVGRRGALFTVVGNELGLVVQVIAVSFGAGALVQRSAEVFTAVKLAGAVYVVYLGVQAIRHRHSMATALAGKLPPVTGGRALRDGFMVGVANPKTIVFLTIALPGFTVTGPGSLPVPVQMIILGMLFPVIALRPGQRVGGRRGHGPAVVRPVAAAAGDDRGNGRAGDDRPWYQPRGNGP